MCCMLHPRVGSSGGDVCGQGWEGPGKFRKRHGGELEQWGDVWGQNNNGEGRTAGKQGVKVRAGCPAWPGPGHAYPN